ncbi:MAG: TauD/TfdA family dioxygenase [Nanoarchaeota archaeon]
MDRLSNQVSDKNLAWDASSLVERDFSYNLSEDVLSELRQISSDNYGESLQLKTAMSEFYRDYLKEGPGFAIIKGLNPTEFSRNKQEAVYLGMCNILGKPLPQNAQGDIRYEVKDMGKTMEAGGRYSETRQSGVLHTDSVQWDSPPDILGLLCLHPAKNGGDSVVVSAHSVHNRLLQENSDLLNVLYEPFPFETRKGRGEIQTIKKPIFTYNERDGLKFRYIGTYIPQDSLTSEQQDAKKALDRLLEDESLIVRIGTLQAGEISFMMNNRMAHGRGSDFVDYEEPEKKRVMIRAWLKERNE